MFQRTRNEEGKHSTRCLFCFRTLTEGVESEEQLDRLEANHLCPERALKDLQEEKERAPWSDAKKRLN